MTFILYVISSSTEKRNIFQDKKVCIFRFETDENFDWKINCEKEVELFSKNLFQRLRSIDFQEEGLTSNQKT